jgi:2-hydroxy-6-oxonona-2,4-dienedioate hydrolase
VIAPELPGIVTGQMLPTIGDYARFVARLLDGLGVERAFVVGNSFGAATGWSLAAREPHRVRALVLVNGGPFDGARDPLTRVLLSVPGGRRLLGWMLRSNTYSPSTIRRAFADPRCAPAEVARTVTRPDPTRIAAIMSIFAHGEPDGATPTVPALVVWGRDDRLIGISVRTGERLVKRLPRARLVVIDRAGHLPQVEQPEAFVAAVEEFLRSM